MNTIVALFIAVAFIYGLLSQANKNPEANKYLIPKLYGSIDALKWVLGFDYINKEGDNNDSSNK